MTIVTPYEKVAPKTDLTLEGNNLRRKLREKGIGERVGHWAEAMHPEGAGVSVVAYDIWRDGSVRTKDPKPGIHPRRRGTETQSAPAPCAASAKSGATASSRKSATPYFDPPWIRTHVGNAMVPWDTDS